MAPRKPFLLRVEPGVLAAIERWAADDLRSVNGQIEFLLRDALRRAGRPVRADEAALVDDEPPAQAAASSPALAPTTPTGEAAPVATAPAPRQPAEVEPLAARARAPRRR